MTKGLYTEFSASSDPSQLKAWTEMAKKADSERGEVLDIYTLQIDKVRHGCAKVRRLLIDCFIGLDSTKLG